MTTRSSQSEMSSLITRSDRHNGAPACTAIGCMYDAGACLYCGQPEVVDCGDCGGSGELVECGDFCARSGHVHCHHRPCPRCAGEGSVRR